MSREPFSWIKRLQSFKYAINGLITLVREEHNARIHLFITLVVMMLSVWLRISTTEWLMIIGAVVLVFCAELFNSSIENLADMVSEEENYRIKKAKDFGAAAVLLVALFAVIIGGFVFVPKLLQMFSYH